MTRPTIRYSLIRFGFSAICGACLGAYLGFASAQERAGTLDTECMGHCTANGYEAEYCGQVCWIPDPAMAARGPSIDWKCTKTCSDRGGRQEDCLQQCRRR